MIRVIYNDGIMDRNILKVQEILLDCDKLTNEWWRRINDNAMWMASVLSATGIVAVYIYRVRDEEDPWYRDDVPTCPYGERICSGLASRLTDEVTMSWWLPGQTASWDYRVSREVNPCSTLNSTCTCSES